MPFSVHAQSSKKCRLNVGILQTTELETRPCTRNATSLRRWLVQSRVLIDTAGPPKKGRTILYKALSEDQQHGNVENQPIPRRPNKVPKKLVKARVAKLVVPADSEGGANIHGQR